MSDNVAFKDFHWDDVDFHDDASVSAVYSGGGGPWRRELVTIVNAYYTHDHFLARGKPGREMEPGLVWELYFHNSDIHERHSKVKPENRHWVTSARFGFGRYAAGKVEIRKADGTVVDPNAIDPEDLKGDTFRHAAGAIWERGNFMKLHRSIKDVVPPPELKDKWEEVRKSNAASAFNGLKCYLAQVDLEMDSQAKERGLENLKAKLRADGAAEEDVDKARYYPPTYIILDEVVEWEDLDAVAAYDPNAPVVTGEAVEFIKSQIAAGNSTIPGVGKAALNDPTNATLHPAVHAALQDVAALKLHGIYWKAQKLSLEA